PCCFQTVQPGSIYHSPYMSANLAEALFQAGFDHTNVLFHGFTPLMTADLDALSSRRGFRGILDQVSWFVNHGADITCPIPLVSCGSEALPSNGNKRFRDLHRIAYWCGSSFYFGDIGEAGIAQLWKILIASNPDPCNCYCAPQGCTAAS